MCLFMHGDKPTDIESGDILKAVPEYGKFQFSLIRNGSPLKAYTSSPDSTSDTFILTPFSEWFYLSLTKLDLKINEIKNLPDQFIIYSSKQDS